MGIVEAAALGAAGLVGMVAITSLALAQVGAHDGRLALALGGLSTFGITIALGRAGAWPRLELNRGEVLLMGVTVIAAAAMFLPGFPYALGDKDPGVYVAHSFAIAREGSIAIEDEIATSGVEFEMLAPGARFPGLWVEPDRPGEVIPQFYHLFPSLLATAIDLWGPPAAWTLNPVLAGLAVLLMALAVRRAAGWWAAWTTVALHVTFMPQVWQARYPSTEILAQLLLNGAILATVLALTRRAWGPASVAGALVGLGFLARPDGLLYVLMALAAVGLLLLARAVDRRVGAFVVGLVLVLPYALWNAYDARAGYTADNGIPSLRSLTVVVAGAGLLIGVGALVAAEAGRRAASWLRTSRVQRNTGLVIVAAAGLALLGFWFREDLLGVDYTYFGSQRIRSYDEQNLRWLAFFLFRPGLVAAWGGLCVVLLRRWRWELLVTVLPGLALLPIYLWEARISPRLMWWVRRFIPGVVPALLVLIAVLAGWFLSSQERRWRALGLGTALSLPVAFAFQSLPLRDHREMGGSYGVVEALSDLAGEQTGIFLFTYPQGGPTDPNRNLPGPLWFIHDERTGYLPDDPTDAILDEYRAAFPRAPIFVVTPPEALPDGLRGAGLAPVLQLRAGITFWEESTADRPNEVIHLPVPLDVWRAES